jgi:glycosyltransferase involved in cell wall biosynthesis
MKSDRPGDCASMTSGIRTIAVASVNDPGDTKTWSGIPAHIGHAFAAAQVNVVQGGPLPASEPSYYRWLRSTNWRLGRGWFLSDAEPRILRQRAIALRSILDRSPADAVISIWADPIAATSPGIPSALVHDCTFALLVDYYQQFTRLTRRSVRLGHEAYKRALEHASISIYSSEWAAQSAIHDYGADPAKVHVVEFGANLLDPPSRSESLRFVDSRMLRGEHRFLFLGVDWARKGGDDAVALVKSLRRMGIPASLDIAGCAMQGDSESREFCFEHGFLDKSKREDSAKLKRLFENASFLLVPSLAECYGCVYCEANAYGIPAIGRDTGGVSQIIRAGVNGFLLTRDGNMDALAEQIRPYLTDPDRYRGLAMSSRNEYETRLNWGRFVNKTLRLFEAVAEKSRTGNEIAEDESGSRKPATG